MRFCLLLAVCIFSICAHANQNCPIFQESSDSQLDPVYEAVSTDLYRYRGDRVFQGLTNNSVALALEPSSAEAWLWRAYMRGAEGKRGDAGRAIERALALAPGSIEVVRSAIILYLRVNHVRSALRLIDATLATYPSDQGLLLQRFVTLAHMNEYEEALRAADFAPKFNAFYENLARLQWRTNRHDEALATLREAIARQAYPQQFYILLANYLKQSGRIEEALQVLQERNQLPEELLRSQYDNIQALILESVLYFDASNRRVPKSLEILAEGLAKFPESAEIRRELQVRLRTVRRFNEAEAYADQVLEKNSRCKVSLITKAISRLNDRDGEGALFFLSRVRVYPSDADINFVYSLFSKALLLSGQPHEALAAAERIESQGLRHWLQAIAYHELHEEDKVVQELVEVYKVAPGLKRHLGLAAILHIFSDRQIPSAAAGYLQSLTPYQRGLVNKMVESLRKPGAPFAKSTRPQTFGEDDWVSEL